MAGKRSGDGFVAHKDTLVNALSRVLAERVTLFDEDVTIGRKGFLGYLKALAGSNIVKIVPANGNASGEQVTDKGVKVVCGSHQSNIPNGAWLKEKMPFTFSQIRISPSNAIMPNLGGAELAEALSRVVPFASTDEARPSLQTVRFYRKDSNLTLTASDGFVLGEVSLDFEDGEGEALIYASELRALLPALRKAKRAKVSFEQKSDDEGGLLAKSLIIDTELVRYKYQSQEGKYPDYGKVIPGEFNAQASFDTKEAIKAIRSLVAVWYDDSLKPLYRALILTVADGKVTIEAKEDRGKAEIPAETSGEVKIAVQGKYLIQALKACGGIADMRLVNAQSPMLFTVDGYRCLVMPLNIEARKAEVTAEAEAKPEAKAEGVAEAKASLEVAKANLKQAEAEGKPKVKAKAKKAVKVAKANLKQAEAVAEAEAEAEAVTEAVAEAEAEAEAVTEEVAEAEAEADMSTAQVVA